MSTIAVTLSECTRFIYPRRPKGEELSRPSYGAMSLDNIVNNHTIDMHSLCGRYIGDVFSCIEKSMEPLQRILGGKARAYGDHSLYVEIYMSMGLSGMVEGEAEAASTTGLSKAMIAAMTSFKNRLAIMAVTLHEERIRQTLP
jgi:hypothetical protein